jgi:hypothetical protein
LVDAHIPQLGFLEVGRDPDVIEVYDAHQLLAGLNILSLLDGAVCNYPIYGSHDGRVSQIQLGLVERRFLAFDEGFRRLGPRTHNPYLLRAGAGILNVSLGLKNFALGSLDLLLGCGG